MHTTIPYYAAFLKDTSVLIVIAFLLSRGRLLRLLFQKRLTLSQTLLLGGLLGLASLGISSLPDVGFQYVTQTVFVAFSTLVGGIYVGLLVTVVSSVHEILVAPYRVIETLLGVPTTWLLASVLRRHRSIPLRLQIGFLAGALAQASRILTHDALVGILHIRPLPPNAWFSIPINGFGVALLLLVVSDAQIRADSERRLLEAEQRRVEAERANLLASEAQLAALRARIHPHFLFNTLNSIAELCCIAPERAETASLNLSHLMRQVLETSAQTRLPLSQELAMTDSYLKIEQERFGERLQIIRQIDASCQTLLIVPFSIQVLVENAVNHGLAPKMEPGTVTIMVRRGKRHLLVAVHDDGVGMPPNVRPLPKRGNGPVTHGVQILNQQLVLWYGEAARLRFFSRENKGTLALFALPLESFAPRESPAKKVE